MKTTGTTLQAGEGAVADEPTTGLDVLDRQPETPPDDAVTTLALPRRRVRLSRRGRRLALMGTAVLAVGGVAGTIGFGLAWQHLQSANAGAASARQAASTFLMDLTNFNGRTVDRDFAAVTGYATGAFENQAQQFFGSNIRQELENAQASSHGQIRSLYLETYSGNQSTVYGVVDQTYSNNKIQTPQSDVLRVVVNLMQASGTWKVSNLTVLEGPQSPTGTSPASGG